MHASRSGDLPRPLYFRRNCEPSHALSVPSGDEAGFAGVIAGCGPRVRISDATFQKYFGRSGKLKMKPPPSLRTEGGCIILTWTCEAGMKCPALGRASRKCLHSGFHRDGDFSHVLASRARMTALIVQRFSFASFSRRSKSSSTRRTFTGRVSGRGGTSN